MANSHTDACIDACPKCCDDTVRLKALGEEKRASRSLTLANGVAVLLLVGHLVFAWVGRPLDLPDYFYAVMLAPYFGQSIRKIVDRFSASKSK